MAPLLTDEAQRWFKGSPELQTQQLTSLARMANLFGQRELSRQFQAAVIRIGQEHGQVSNQNLGYWQTPTWQNSAKINVVPSSSRAS